jgi:hypothetical protein
MRKQKGWIGYVRSDYINNENHDKVDWNGGTKKPKSTETDVMGKEIQKW